LSGCRVNLVRILSQPLEQATGEMHSPSLHICDLAEFGLHEPADLLHVLHITSLDSTGDPIFLAKTTHNQFQARRYNSRRGVGGKYQFIFILDTTTISVILLSYSSTYDMTQAGTVLRLALRFL
jgi:hypothetical protein